MSTDRDLRLARLREPGPHLGPSLLECDFGRLADEIANCLACGAPSVQWDVMDGHFVPNLTYGPPLLASLRAKSDAIFDAHLMISDPQKYLDAFLKAGSDIITVHLEALANPGDLLRRIRAGGALAGLAINPATPVEGLVPWLDQLDLILIMSVEPGFGGQKFDQRAIEKLRWAKRTARRGTLIQVDGGINRSTISEATAAGADLLVVGSAFFRADDRLAEFQSLMRLATEGLRKRE